jgi:primase-polymerase (primpol)-like protein
MTPEFERAVGGMADIAQWFVWRLEWDDAQGKFLKRPARLDGAALGKDESKQFVDYDAARDAVLRLNAGVTNGHLRYAMGFWLTADCGYWFLDIDKCAQDGVLLPFAAQMVGAFPGAMMEWSSSGKGVHVIGMGQVPASHRNKPPRDVKLQLLPLELEFYSADRGIAFGLDGVAQGCADAMFDVGPLCATYFPSRPERESEGVRPEWRGPTDDDVLLERALNSRQSAASAFGGKASIAQLFRGECEQNSEADMALASHLAFWTGCDEERIERIMRRSGLARDKWNDRRPGGTYLTFTIANACASCENVYQEPERNLAIQTEMYGGAVTTHVQGELISEE